jgi:DNA-binding MarR family transcriptional regulator
MNEINLAPPPEGTKLPALTPASYRVLRLLQKGSAYQARGTWRFRGSHGPTNGRTLVGLLEKGLAERVEIDRCSQVRITTAGRSVNQEGSRQQSTHR